MKESLENPSRKRLVIRKEDSREVYVEVVSVGDFLK